MNILPKKNWHVRNRDNIERVKKDEAKAAEEEKKQLTRAATAEREARTKFLRDRAHSKGAISFVGSEVVPVNDTGQSHVNFFNDLEKETKKGNKDHEAEKKSEQEAWEKKVGILTQLGQTVTDGQHKTLADGLRVPLPEVDPDIKRKDSMDPLNMMKKYLGHGAQEEGKQTSRKRRHEPSQGNSSTSESQAMSTKLAYQSHISVSHHHSSSREKKQEKKDKTKKHKRKHRHKHKKDKNKDTVSHSVDIQQLRAERLKREDEEKKRAARLLSGKSDDVVQEVRLTDALDGRYNAQFHPHLARQRLCNDFKFK
ncbi:putative leukocyte receptor cluster member 1 [Apostichopus japonicus]|uniref:Putative leukocyte receptor cluster member 1 n=1 Tax=Stichopus japonicus TaxID=307972 RepID=A0A2G8KGH4_STIJA|nr:putative leukocyte receptor cluster member 1 [Apostichopus japonicus]